MVGARHLYRVAQMELSKQVNLWQWMIDTWVQQEFTQKELPDFPGLFGLWVHSADDSVVLHIGKATENIKSFVQNHELSPLLKILERLSENEGTDFILYIGWWSFPALGDCWPDQELLDKWQLDLIRELKPVLQDSCLISKLQVSAYGGK